MLTFFADNAEVDSNLKVLLSIGGASSPVRKGYIALRPC
jgi:hypothetical protein